MSEEIDEQWVERVADESGRSATVVQAILEQAKAGATVPFLARYRKELTGGMDEVQLRDLLEIAERAQEFLDRRKTILHQLEATGAWTAERELELFACKTKQDLEDFYLPFKPKRRSKATEAIERGLEPLALRILEQPEHGDFEAEVASFVRPEAGVPDRDAALSGARAIAIDRLATDPDLRRSLREVLEFHAEIQATKSIDFADKKTPYDDWAEHTELFRTIASHRVHALLRGQKEEVLHVKLVLDKERTLAFIARRVGLVSSSPFAAELEQVIQEAWTSRLSRSLQTEVLAARKERADEDAARVFAENLHHLLLAAPLGSKAVIGIDPGFKSGCKCAAIDATGRFQATITLFPHQGERGEAQSREQLLRFLKAHPAAAIGVGNGTAGRETERFVRKSLAGTEWKDVVVVSVNESGASVYSASELAREEFPDLDLTVRGAISIARRLQDPLAELVKIDPRAIGVGQYQHDVEPSLLEKRLEAVIETCVNRVGVDVDTASAPLLARVAGIGPKVARSIVSHRDANGPFPSRAALLKVKGLGERTFEQAAGFLRVPQSQDVLDRSAVHPERYTLVRKMAEDLAATPKELIGQQDRLRGLNLERYVSGDVGLPTLRDIVDELLRPGRDPRKDFSPPRFRDDVNSLSDLVVGMELEGVVTNVTAFGAFVDVGVHCDGLVHKSALWRPVRDPSEVLHLGLRLLVRVESVDLDRERIALKGLKPVS